MGVTVSNRVALQAVRSVYAAEALNCVVLRSDFAELEFRKRKWANKSPDERAFTFDAGTTSAKKEINPEATGIFPNRHRRRSPARILPNSNGAVHIVIGAGAAIC